MNPLQALLAALLFVLCAGAARAERTPPRAAPLGEDGNTRVIVKFKPTASLLRAHALSATDHAATASALERRAGVLGRRVGLVLRAGTAVTDNAQVVQAEGVNARSLAARLALDPDVEYAVVDRRVRRLRLPNDPRYASVAGTGPAVGQWYLRAPAGALAASIDAASAWDTTTGSAGIVVAVVDTGVRANHPDLAGKLLPGYDMISDAAISNDGDGRDSDASDPGDWLTQAEINADAAAHPTNPTFTDCTPSDSSWHGTQVAGIVGAATDNGTGMAGAGWNVRVLPVRVLGKCFGYTSDIIAGMRWAAGLHVDGVPDNPNPAQVINLSLGGSGACDAPERDAIAEIVGDPKGPHVVVAAAGNSEGLAAGSPANCPGVIGVTALRHVGTKVGFADVGPEISIAAPGGNCVNLSGACLYPILTTTDSGAKGPVSATYSDSFNPSLGTSFSSPLVSATAALMFAVQPSLTPAAVRAAIQASARPFPASGLPPPDPAGSALVACHAPNGIVQDECYCTTATCGAGMLDAGAAVRAALCSSLVIAASPSSPTPGAAVVLSTCSSTLGSGRRIVDWQWSVVDAGGTGSVLAGGTTAAVASLQTTTAGTVTVQMVATDDLGTATTVQQSIAVAAAVVPAPPVPPTPPAPPAMSDGGGGGALSWPWVLALLTAAAALAPLRPRRSS
jgi:serine protease